MPARLLNRKASCHTSRKHYAHGLCKGCYDTGNLSVKARIRKAGVAAIKYRRHRNKILRQRGAHYASSASHRARCIAQSKRWARDNPERHRLTQARRQAQFRGQVSLGEWQEIQAAHDFRCKYCRRKGKLTMDHVLAISKGGWHIASNIVPACKPCNSSKGTSSVVTWRQRMDTARTTARTP